MFYFLLIAVVFANVSLFAVDIHVPLSRLGKHGDGGYHLPTTWLNNQTSLHMISAGVSDDTSFEEAVFALFANCTVDLIDFSVTEPSFARNNNAVTFYPDKLSDSKTLANYERDKTLLLKVDIEGAEFDVFEHERVDFLRSVDVLVTEFHMWSPPRSNGDMMTDQELAVMAKLKEIFYLAHVHVNVWGRHCLRVSKSSEFSVQALWEYLFINKKLIDDEYNVKEDVRWRHGYTLDTDEDTLPGYSFPNCAHD